MRGRRRFSQAISEGESISLLVAVANADGARSADGDGAEAVVVRGRVAGVRDATELPILWSADAEADDAAQAGADAWVLAVAGGEDEEGRLEHLHQACLGRGLDCVVAVRDEDELRLALDRLDPDIFLLAAQDAPDGGAVEHVLSLLPDVPAGKLAIADLERAKVSDVEELERAGVDAVVVRAADLAHLAGSRHGV
jgi:indole-3-glycerol phosphate synthase